MFSSDYLIIYLELAHSKDRNYFDLYRIGILFSSQIDILAIYWTKKWLYNGLMD